LQDFASIVNTCLILQFISNLTIVFLFATKYTYDKKWDCIPTRWDADLS